MAFFFTDSNGTRRRVSQTLVDQGIISRETPIESDNGQTGRAKQIPGLQFPGSDSAIKAPAVSPSTIQYQRDALTEEERNSPAISPNTFQYQYKCVAAPRIMVLQRSDKAPNKVIADFSNFINSGCANGWEYYAMEEMEVHEAEGCLLTLFRMIPLVGQVLSIFIREPGAFHYNVLIFRKPL